MTSLCELAESLDVDLEVEDDSDPPDAVRTLRGYRAFNGVWDRLFVVNNPISCDISRWKMLTVLGGGTTGSSLPTAAGREVGLAFPYRCLSAREAGLGSISMAPLLGRGVAP